MRISHALLHGSLAPAYKTHRTTLYFSMPVLYNSKALSVIFSSNPRLPLRYPLPTRLTLENSVPHFLHHLFK